MGLDGISALRIDVASAYLGEFSDYDREYAMLDEVLSAIIMLSKVMGNKRAKYPKRKKLVGDLFKKRQKDIPLKYAISSLLTKGTIME